MGLCLELPTERFISHCVMPENNSPTTKPEPGEVPAEFNFTKPAENPRIKRRSLKAKPPGALKPANAPLSAARELEHKAPPLSAEQARPEAKPRLQEDHEIAAPATTKAAEPATGAPPRTTPTQTKPTSPATRPASPTPANSPHGTRPATLYYSSYPRKEKEAPSPMKSTPTASPASSSSAVPLSSSAPRTTAPPQRTATPIDYRANVERQAREQKSVGNVLAYLVYSLIGLFVLGALLAGYGTYVLSKQIQAQSMTVSDLDQRYAAANKDLIAKLASTQDSLTQAMAQIDRQQDLILKEQEAINQLIATTTETNSALKQEKQARAQETQARTQDTANLRARIRDLEYRGPTTQKY
jgi:hypothetical protein